MLHAQDGTAAFEQAFIADPEQIQAFLEASFDLNLPLLQLLQHNGEHSSSHHTMLKTPLMFCVECDHSRLKPDLEHFAIAHACDALVAHASTQTAISFTLHSIGLQVVCSKVRT